MTNEHTEHSLLNPHPNTIQDSSTGAPGIVAGELAAEEQSLLDAGKDYGSIPQREQEGEVHETLSTKQLRFVISGLFMASFLAAMDGTIVTTLMTTIASDLNAVKVVSWIATSYMLSASAFQPLFGKLSDIFGRRVLLLICSGLFALGCAMCATDSLTMLITGRFVTGIGASGYTCLGTMTMSDLIPTRERGFYQGFANVFFGLGSASGGFIGGIVADTFGWKSVFIMQVPLAGLVFLVTYLFLHLPAGSPGLGYTGQNVKEKLKRVDFLGSFFLVSALIFLMTAAAEGGNAIAFTSKVFITLVVLFVIFIAGFVYTEMYLSEEPIIPLELMTYRTVLASSLANWFSTMGMFALMFYVPFYYSSVLQLTPTQNGTRQFPNFFSISLGSVGAGLYMKKTGKYYKYAAIVILATVFGSARVLFLNQDSSLFFQFTAVIIPGFGYSTLITITLLALIASAPFKFQARTTSIQYTFRSTGSTIGLSVASAIFQNILKSSLLSKVNAVVKDSDEAQKIINKALENTEYVREAPKYVRAAILDSYEAGCKGAFVFAFVAFIMGYIAVLFMKEHKLHTTINRD